MFLFLSMLSYVTRRGYTDYVFSRLQRKWEVWNDESKSDANIKRKYAESCTHWLESDVIGILSGLVHLEFQKFVSVL